MSYGAHEYGGGPEPPNHEGHGGGTSVTDLHGPSEGEPDVRFELTARAAEIRLSSGRIVHALTYNGTSPGPELRVRQGDLVEVVLRNDDVSEGVTIHWHGVDVPNAEDGVAGVTQNAVLPGQTYTYRFRADQVGTFWYHTHQVSSQEVRRGLFGVIVIEPREQPARSSTSRVVAHTFDGVATLNGETGQRAMSVPAGTPVRTRLVNTDSSEQTFTVSGTPFRVLAIDGPTCTDRARYERRDPPARSRRAGRHRLRACRRTVCASRSRAPRCALGLGPSGGPAPGEVTPTSDFDPLTYGTPAPTPFDASSTIRPPLRAEDHAKARLLRRHARVAVGDQRPHLPGRAGVRRREGRPRRVTITNDTNGIHPMHLHGHHLLVLSRDGQPSTGSPWWSDTLNVLKGESYVVAFRADNPGIWMDHCHNLKHAAQGLTMHVAYAGVSTPFLVGDEPGNRPE